MFIGREEELREINNMLDTERSEALLMYGRRRVGKSALIDRALTGRKERTIRYVCLNTTYEENFNRLSETVTESFGEGFLSFSNLGNLLEYIYKKAEKEKVILFIDEYPYLRGNNAAIDSYFQEAIDHFSEGANLKLILCGSFMDVMRRIVEEEDAPLRGRFRSIIRLKPFDYYDASEFYPGYSDEDKVIAYSCFGGIPFYLTMIDTDVSVEENIRRLLLKSESILENEIRLTLQNELAKTENANYVLSRIAEGVVKYSDLNTGLGKKSPNGIQHILNKLMQMDLVAKYAPINAERDAKKTKYCIADNLVDMYYTFCFFRQSEREFLGPERFFESFVKEKLYSEFVPHKFEDIATQYLIRQNRNGNTDKPFTKIGRFYYDDPVNKLNGEFDVVTLDADGWTDYECKYRSKPVNASMVEEEITHAEKLGLNFYRYGFISKSGFADDFDHSKYQLITLKDIYR